MIFSVNVTRSVVSLGIWSHLVKTSLMEIFLCSLTFITVLSLSFAMELLWIITIKIIHKFQNIPSPEKITVFFLTLSAFHHFFFKSSHNHWQNIIWILRNLLESVPSPLFNVVNTWKTVMQISVFFHNIKYNCKTNITFN